MADEPTPETGDDDTAETAEDTDTDTGDDKAKPSRRSGGLQAALHKANAEAAKYRTEAAALKKQLDDSQSKTKSEMDKLIGRFDAMEERATKAERKALVAEIGEEHGLTAAQASRLRGDTREELVADAEELRETFGVKAKPKPKASDESDAGDEADGKAKANGKDDGAKPSLGRPKEKLRGGASPPDTEEAVDPAKLAKSILESSF
jgi:hypothetical protein